VTDQTQARLQRIEEDVRSLNARYRVLAAVDDTAVRQQIADTFGDDARMAIIYRGVQLGKTQQEIAAALAERNLPLATQPRVSESLGLLVDRGFVTRKRNGPFTAAEGWSDFGLDRTIRKTLRKHNVRDFA
jgi:hypothetical protein